ncbi:hypothetical protein VFPPC_15045 [Pochonia chlamydosporia 170]|uniref:Uncharacterized protein n=1 Tax=Pochonia chlamydosporia 170 TaxID=1380566 RepID=A0A179G2F3_METCM|nr:hypothetical protein VFPPC_15045 [Pochonia chlamydosporia 170]OAQ71917.1 hypothetical protein VFPPC_15045 [Pochonia chlamydosporia 170]
MAVESTENGRPLNSQPFVPRSKSLATIKAKQHDVYLRGVLGGRTIQEVSDLPMEKRTELLRSVLVQENQPIVINAMACLSQLASHVTPAKILAPKELPGFDTSLSRLLKEAQEIYYGENHFVVDLCWLHDFVFDRTGGCGVSRGSVAEWVKQLTVVIDITHDKDEEQRDLVLEQLRYLERFKKAERVTIELQGGGMLNGSDLATHTKMKTITPAVRELVDMFPVHQLLIHKVICNGSFQNIRNYWNDPTDADIADVRLGRADFAAVMRVQTKSWTHGK